MAPRNEGRGTLKPSNEHRGGARVDVESHRVLNSPVRSRTPSSADGQRESGTTNDPDSRERGSLGVDAPVPQQLGRPVFGRARLDPAWDGIFELQPTASSSYHGIMVALHRRLAHEVEWSTAYMVSRETRLPTSMNNRRTRMALADEWADSRTTSATARPSAQLFDLPVGEEEDRRSVRCRTRGTAFSHIELARF
jgi:hypothetical protein